MELVMESQERRIVIVEDEGLIAADLQGRLERAGYRVPAVAGSGKEALKVIGENSPDLVLMDIRLQGNMDGIQVAERVRSDYDIPVVFLTAYEDAKTLERAGKTQAFGYIKKPLASASLQGSIEMALAKHRQERYLREQRDWFSASFAAVPDGVLVTDGIGRVCYLNPVAEQLTGQKVEDSLGKPAAELLRFKRADGSAVDDLIPLVMLQGAPVPLPAELWLEGAQNKKYAVEGSLAPRWQEGRADGVVVTFKDVTLRRFEIEQARQDGRHEALSRLADGVAGQLDLELSVVAEESTRLLNALPSDSTLRATAETIESAALDAFAVTCRLRAFGQDREIKPHTVWVNEILQQLQSTWNGALPGLALELDPDPRPVHADANELKRVLDLLFQHAHRWMDAASGIQVVARGAESAGLPEWVQIRVSYAANGEDAKALERVFDPSWDGNWEGLPFAYGLTKRMGGLLRAVMDAQQTVVFDVFLPSVEVAAAGAMIEPEEQPVLLVIDRNSEVRRMLHAHFEMHGYNVLEAGNSEEALLLAKLYGRPIQLVVANLAADDELRAELAPRMVELMPGVCVRIIEAYREESACANGIGAETAWRYLTKWELLEWANESVGPVAWLAAAQ
jgi:PAS domain S-box-containing protein